MPATPAPSPRPPSLWFRLPICPAPQRKATSRGPVRCPHSARVRQQIRETGQSRQHDAISAAPAARFAGVAGPPASDHDLSRARACPTCPSNDFPF
eukprot:scaffold29394_cov112-Isochrysis_galbana.AAC.4